MFPLLSGHTTSIATADAKFGINAGITAISSTSSLRFMIIP